MCGIVGLVGPGQLSNDLKALRQLIYVCALRGTDSTGLVTVSSGARGEIRVWKDAVPAAYALWKDAKDKRPMLNSLLPSLYMAHCRDATVGRITADNAHPFRAGDLIGMHNGTLKDAEFFRGGRTDSENMFIAMSKKGIKNVLESLDARSAFAISVYDKAKKEISFARSDVNKRPLFFATHPKRRILFYASEKEMLQLVLTRCDIAHKIHEAKAGILYTINPDDIVAGDELPFTETPLELRKPTKSDFDWGEWERYATGNYENVPWDDDISVENKSTSIISVDSKGNVVPKETFTEDNVPNFLKAKPEVFQGCMFCRSILTQGEQAHCELHPETSTDGKKEIVYMCTDCRGVYEGVATTTTKVSAM